MKFSSDGPRRDRQNAEIRRRIGWLKALAGAQIDGALQHSLVNVVKPDIDISRTQGQRDGGPDQTGPDDHD
jgi:hypothetical protein